MFKRVDGAYLRVVIPSQSSVVGVETVRLESIVVFVRSVELPCRRSQ